MGFSKDPSEILRKEKFTKEEIRMAIRNDISAEIDAMNFYLTQASLIDDDLVRKVLLDIAMEEKVHLGEFLTLLKKLDDEQVKAIEKGEEEVKEMEKY